MRSNRSEQESLDQLLWRSVHEALALAQRHLIREAKLRMSVPDDAISDELFTGQLVELQSGLILCQSQRFGDAARCFQNASPLIESIENQPDIQSILRFLANAAIGFSSLYDGDPSTAMRHLEESEKILKPLILHHPELAPALWAIKNAMYSSLAQFYIGRGDLANVEKVYGRAFAHFSDIQKQLDENSADSHVAFVEIYGSILEFTINFSSNEIFALRFKDARRRLESAEESVAKFRKHVEFIENNSQKAICNAVSLLFDASLIICAAGEHLIENKKDPTKELLSSLESLPDLLFQARDSAVTSGQRGERLSNYMANLQRYSDSIIRIAQPSRTTSIQAGSLVFLASFTLLFVPTAFFGGQSGFSLIIYTTIFLVVALVAGFGYGALRFLPLIAEYRKLLREVQRFKDP